jgi:hypothetical protein
MDYLNYLDFWFSIFRGHSCICSAVRFKCEAPFCGAATH